MSSIERPLDLLNRAIGKIVMIKLKDVREELKVQLLAFDIHINLVVMKDGKAKFIRGENIISVEEF